MKLLHLFQVTSLMLALRTNSLLLTISMTITFMTVSTNAIHCFVSLPPLKNFYKEDMKKINTSHLSYISLYLYDPTVYKCEAHHVSCLTIILPIVSQPSRGASVSTIRNVYLRGCGGGPNDTFLVNDETSAKTLVPKICELFGYVMNVNHPSIDGDKNKLKMKLTRQRCEIAYCHKDRCNHNQLDEDSMSSGEYTSESYSFKSFFVFRQFTVFEEFLGHELVVPGLNDELNPDNATKMYVHWLRATLIVLLQLLFYAIQAME